MGERPSSDYVLSRVGDKGNYEPGNCRWITKRENSLEMDTKGERNNQAKLTEDDVIKIRSLYVPHKYPTTRLAKEFDVSKGTIHHIIRGRTWKHVGA